MRKLESEADGCYSWSNGPNHSYAPHSHTYRKILYCVEGSIRFDVEGGESFDLRAGDRLELAPGTVHSAQVGPGGVTCIEGQAG